MSDDLRPYYPVAELVQQAGITWQKIEESVFSNRIQMSIKANAIVTVETSAEDEPGAPSDAVYAEDLEYFGLFPLRRSDAFDIVTKGQAHVKYSEDPDPETTVYITKPSEGISVKREDLVLSPDEFEKAIRRFSKAPVPPTNQSNTIPKRRGPRPEYDWDGAFQAAGAHLKTGQTFKNQADCIRFIIDWFEDKFGKAPDNSSVRKKIENQELLKPWGIAYGCSAQSVSRGGTRRR